MKSAILLGANIWTLPEIGFQDGNRRFHLDSGSLRQKALGKVGRPGSRFRSPAFYGGIRAPTGRRLRANVSRLKAFFFPSTKGYPLIAASELGHADLNRRQHG